MYSKYFTGAYRPVLGKSGDSSLRIYFIFVFDIFFSSQSGRFSQVISHIVNLIFVNTWNTIYFPDNTLWIIIMTQKLLVKITYW